MNTPISIVVTSIAKPNRALSCLAEGCINHGLRLIVIGDVLSPADFHINNCDFISIKMQKQLDLIYPKLCPERHYARKNIGYLMEIKKGAEIIIDTDDDNIPYKSFWNQRNREVDVSTINTPGWVNVYRYFTDELIWPRGFPLNKINVQNQPYESLPLKTMDCPIQQGLVNEDPDVDAIFRLVFSQTIHFREDRKLVLAKGSWCPFNSQNTTWWSDAFPLLYLPSTCSFRMTDIIRSFVAQRIAWENEWTVLFHEPNMWQERNEHDLMKDFNDEIPGYLNNDRISNELKKLSIRKGINNLMYNLENCYEKLMEMGVINKKEISLLSAWIKDLEDIKQRR